jgi:hypothetical protein
MTTWLDTLAEILDDPDHAIYAPARRVLDPILPPRRTRPTTTTTGA